MAKIQIVDIIDTLVSNLGYTFIITDNTVVPEGQVLSTDNTYYLNEGKKLSIGGFDYQVVSFVFNESITIKKLGHINDVTTTSFELPPPKFFSGSVKSTKDEVSKYFLKIEYDVPVVYLFRGIKENTNFRTGERSAPILLFIVDLSSYRDKRNIDIDNQIIKPLSNVECALLDRINKRKEKNILPLTENHRTENHQRFARSDRNGEIKTIFSGEWSAIELDLKLQVNKC